VIVEPGRYGVEKWKQGRWEAVTSYDRTGRGLTSSGCNEREAAIHFRVQREQESFTTVWADLGYPIQQSRYLGPRRTLPAIKAGRYAVEQRGTAATFVTSYGCISVRQVRPSESVNIAHRLARAVGSVLCHLGSLAVVMMRPGERWVHLC